MKKFNDFQPSESDADVQGSDKRDHKKQSITIPSIGLTDVPSSICTEMKEHASSILNQPGFLVAGPPKSNMYLIQNQKKPCEPYQVSFDKRNSRVVCNSRKCFRSTDFGVCGHSIAVAIKEGFMDAFVEKFNRSKAHSTVKKLADAGKEERAGKKRTKSTQRRKGPANCVKPKIQKYIASTDLPANPQAIASDGGNHLCQPIISGMQAATTVSQPPQPDPPVHGYVLALLRFCHRNVAVCYKCSGKFYEHGYPQPPNDMVVVSKTQRKYFDVNVREWKTSGEFAKVYYHFNRACIAHYNQFFSPQMIAVPPELKPFLLPEHRQVLQSCGIAI